MRCDFRILLLLNAFAIVVHVFGNVAAGEPYDREEPQYDPNVFWKYLQLGGPSPLPAPREGSENETRGKSSHVNYQNAPVITNNGPIGLNRGHINPVFYNGVGRGNGTPCRNDQLRCKYRPGCVEGDALCNGVADCEDGSDESDCTAIRSTRQPNGFPPIRNLASGCTMPQQPTGGSFELGEASGIYLIYKCNEGYTMKGNNVSVCHNGTWSYPPTCEKTCPALKSNRVDMRCEYRGEIVSCGTAIAPGTKATLACKTSYILPHTSDPSYREVNCLAVGMWDNPLISCIPVCGTAVPHGNKLIVNGFTAELGGFPWHVGIYRRGSDGKYEQICGGTLISPNLVISAAHCFYDDTVNAVLDASQYAVAAGKHYRAWVMPEKYAQTSPVRVIDVPARYNGLRGNFAQDISLVHLEKPFDLTTLVAPICMDWDNVHAREQLQSGQSGKAVGWGKTAAGEPSNELQEINLPYIPYKECKSAVPEDFRGFITADKFCAGYLNGSSLCDGDSGGGLYFQLNDVWYLRGVVSVSPVSQSTCDNNYYTAFTNVGYFAAEILAAYNSAHS